MPALMMVILLVTALPMGSLAQDPTGAVTGTIKDLELIQWQQLLTHPK